MGSHTICFSIPDCGENDRRVGTTGLPDALILNLSRIELDSDAVPCAPPKGAGSLLIFKIEVFP